MARTKSNIGLLLKQGDQTVWKALLAEFGLLEHGLRPERVDRKQSWLRHRLRAAGVRTPARGRDPSLLSHRPRRHAAFTPEAAAAPSGE